MIRSIVMLGFVFTAAGGFAAEGYPNRPLRFVVPFPPPGGANDTVARLVGPKITERLGQQVVVHNRPGGSGSVALDLTARPGALSYSAPLGGHPHLDMLALASATIVEGAKMRRAALSGA